MIATIHLAMGNFGELLGNSSKLLPMLQADATAVAANDARYEAEKESLILANQYEKLAALRGCWLI